MAVTQGSSAIYTDMKYWYDQLNTIIGNYGGGVIAQMTVPAQAGIKATDINTLKSKVDEMKADTYLGSVPSLYPTYSVVTAGTQIQATIGAQYNTLISSLQAIKCRNMATNSSGSCSNQANSNGTCSNVSKGIKNSNGSNSSGTRYYGIKSSGGCSNATCSSGSNSNGTKSNTSNSQNNSNGSNSNGNKTNGTNSNTTVIDILCSLATKSNGG